MMNEYDYNEDVNEREHSIILSHMVQKQAKINSTAWYTVGNTVRTR